MDSSIYEIRELFSMKSHSCAKHTRGIDEKSVVGPQTWLVTPTGQGEQSDEG